MGLLDILNGMQNGPHGQKQAPASGTGSGGMSPTMMALLALLAYKAFKGSGQPAPSGARPAPAPGGGLGDILGGMLGGGSRPGTANPGGGGLGDILGGMLSGGNAGSILNGGLGNILKDLQAQGHANKVQSWVGTGPNQSIAPSDLEHAVGVDTLDELVKQSGMPRSELLSGLSQQLPELVDQLTPDGRLPTDQEADRWV